MQQEDVITMRCDHEVYTPAAATDVLSMFKRRGWIPPSEQHVYQEKWAYYKSLANKTEQ